MLVHCCPNAGGTRRHHAVNRRPNGDQRRGNSAFEAGGGPDLFVEEVRGGGKERQGQAQLAEAPPGRCTFRRTGGDLIRDLARYCVLARECERAGCWHVTITFTN